MESVATAINKSSNAAQSLNHSEQMRQRVVCPAPDSYYDHPNYACQYQGSLKYTIIHLNDEHKWSREDIADWLDTLENQPVFYPDIRTDDEKIEDAKKEKQTLWSNPNHNILADLDSAKQSFLNDFLLSAGPTNSGPIKYYENTPISSYNTYAPQLKYGGMGLNAESTVTIQHGGSTINGYVQSIETHYSSYGHNTYTVTFHAI